MAHSVSRGGQRDRKRDRDRRPDAKLAGHGGRAAQPVEQLPRDAESEARPTELSRPGLVDLTEVFPDRLQVLGLDADPAVGDVDDHVLAVTLGVEPNPSLLRELD